MDNNSLRAAWGQMPQGQGGAREASAPPSAANAVAATTMDNVDWRTQLHADSRQRIVNKIMETLKKHLPLSAQEQPQKVKQIAVRFEEKIYNAATSQSDYLGKISTKMLSMEMESQNPLANYNVNKNPSDPVGHMQSQVHNQYLSASMVNNPSEALQQLLVQNMQNSITSGEGQNSASLTSTLPPVGNLTQASMPYVVGQNNLQNMSNISTITQNPVGTSMGQGMPADVFANSQRQMLGRWQVVPQQLQQQSTSPHLLYQQQVQQQYMKEKMQQRSIPQSKMQSHIQQQQQQQYLLQPSQIETSQQPVMQPSVMQSTSLSNLQQNQQSPVQQVRQPVIQQHYQSVMREQQLQPQPQPQHVPNLHQHQTPMSQQQMLPAAQQQQQQPNIANIPQNQLIGQPNSIHDLLLQQRLMSQQNNISNLKQQQLIGKQNNLSNIHQSQLGSQSSVSGFQQSQMLGTQSGNSGIPVNQHSVHMIQQKVPEQQQMQNANFVLNQDQQSRTQPLQQQMMSQIQFQSGQLQHLQQQSNPMQRDIQKRLQNSGALFQHQNVVEQQKQLFQSQRAIPEASSTSLDSTAQTGNTSGGDWQEEVHQKIKAMKEMYFTELNEMYSKIAAKVQQHESISQQTKNEQVEKLKLFKDMLERLLQYLRLNKNDVQIGHKENLGSVKKQIVSLLHSYRPGRAF